MLISLGGVLDVIGKVYAGSGISGRDEGVNSRLDDSQRKQLGENMVVVFAGCRREGAEVLMYPHRIELFPQKLNYCLELSRRLAARPKVC
jgi:hypothetical protein